MILKVRMARLAAVALLAAPLGGCLHYEPPASPEEAQMRMMMLGMALQNADAALRQRSAGNTVVLAPPVSGSPIRTYIVNGEAVTCSTVGQITNCN